MRELLEKDEWTCWLCGDYVVPELDEPTRDHVIPFAQGGTNHISNLRLAHRECNEARENPAEEVVAIDVILGNRALRNAFNIQT